jgi:L-ascorbate metabolism protein UlaG (beta-lactamase superfamily)
MKTKSKLIFAFGLILPALFLAGCTGGASAERVDQIVDQITWLRSTNPYGHTGILIQANDLNIYLDPVDLASIETLPKADIILVTHNQADHFSAETIADLTKDGTVIVAFASPTMSALYPEAVLLAPGESERVDGINIEAVPAYNSNHARGMGFVGFLLTIDGVRGYCSGDTELSPEMLALADIDIAMLNVRAGYSLSGEDAADFAEQVGPQVLIPIHWMPEDDTYDDGAQIDILRQDLPATTHLVVLELK